jgi:tRNA-splicing ligase RtcB
MSCVIIKTPIEFGYHRPIERKNAMTIRIWGTDFDQNILLQAERTARLPIMAGHVALMPDAHLGIGATVGSVIPTKNAIIPAAVGVDIGCGMIAVETDLRAEQLPDNLQPLVRQFGRSVPAGVGRGRNLQSTGASDQRITRRAEKWLSQHPHELPDGLERTALSQLGTLGSGNHFLEVCLDEREVVWVVLHSGSRGVGNKLADRHIKLARQQEQALEDRDLAYFLEGTTEFQAYVADMLWAQSYALENRELMLNAALDDLFTFSGAGHEVGRINCHHNFAQREEHEGRWLWITRKGAIRAARGDMGVIPGSMGTRSYIVRGLGNSESYMSSSHGAGRRMSRGQARRELTEESLVEAMKGKAWNQDAKGLLDEHPLAYKDIDQVMEAQKDLVEIVHTLRQVANYKGL